MLPLTQIAALRTTVDDEWRSPVADAVGRAWDIPAGGLRYWRSSAAHVFVVPPGGDARGVLYARFAPAGSASGAHLQRGAQLHDRLTDAGAPVAELVRSCAGRAVELIHTPLGEMAACVVKRVDGEELDVDGLDAGAAAAWGAALAEFHRTAGEVVPPSAPPPRNPFAVLARHMTDPDLAAAAQELAMHWGPESGPLVVGHGDFELDNLRWSAGRPTSFDLDEAGVMPAAADMSAAVRDLLGPRPAAPLHPELLAAFVDGYRRTAGHAVTLDALLLHRAAFAAQQLAEASDVMDRGPDGEGWLSDLVAGLNRHYAEQRDIVVATAEGRKPPTMLPG
ncbi:phosphotransferase [Pseudarthrobacter sp. R1]|uniref:phosphotransferase n=1 Tax=Pseudarthrobacter sp. R1 TaxID=2944934 RepID=UPI002109BFB9|nr:phosphotransferase [Pseudarthrobacter sp. R1]MCQ6269033.1 phosphotransferase [Pseudarthrobacter sp. R1]